MTVVFAVDKSDTPNQYIPANKVSGGRNRLSKLLHTFYTLCPVVKADFPNLYTATTPFAVVKTDSPNFFKHSMRFSLVKTDFLNIYMPT